MENREYEVVVCGGGTAGIAAALAARRHGKKTLLAEKQYLLGGLATAGIVTIYLPLCDGMGHQVSFGIAEELLRLSIKYGVEDRFPDAWLGSRENEELRKTQRFEVQFNPHLFAIAAEELLLQEGVDILYGTTVSDVILEGSRIAALVLENKSGRFTTSVQSVVDATGDADIVYRTGVPTATYQQKNILASWYYSIGSDGYRLHMLGFADKPDEEKTEEEKSNQNKERFLGLEGEEITSFMVKSHQCLLQDYLKRKKDDDSFFPVTMASIPQLRMTRRIEGESCMSTLDDHRSVSDSVGLISNWKNAGLSMRFLFQVYIRPNAKTSSPREDVFLLKRLCGM